MLVVEQNTNMQKQGAAPRMAEIMEQDAKEEHAKEERNTKDSRGSGRATPAAEVVKQDEERTACHQGQLQRAAGTRKWKRQKF